MPEINIKLIIKIVAVLFLLFFISSSFFIVSPTEMAGTRWLGGRVMESTPLRTGIHFKIPFLEDVDTLQTSRSTVVLRDLPLHTKDNQKVNISVGVLYHIPSTSVFNLLYNVGRAGNVDIKDTILPIIMDRALATFAQYDALNISEDRGAIAVKMQTDISNGLRKLFGIEVDNVQLIDIKYSPEFEQSVQQAVQAKAQADQAQNTVAKKQYEGEQKIVTAEAQAKAAIAEANGEAQSKLIKSEAIAKSINIIGQALNNNNGYIKYFQLQQWNGKVPKYVGQSALYPMLDLGTKK
jgi:regulator of protease activity HflC (stomatin/prohibitin superfamily)